MDPPPRRVLCLNAGSSSLKAALFALPASAGAKDAAVASAAAECLARGAVDGVGAERGRLRWSRTSGMPGTSRAGRDAAHPPGRTGDGVAEGEATREGRFASQADAAEALLDALAPASDRGALAGVGHRVVHGGPGFETPRRLDAALEARLRAAADLAPLHLPGALAVLDAAREALPAVPQVACFDGAFHAALPEEAVRLPLPEALHEAGVRRIGFHGLSFTSVVAQLGAALAPRTVIAHLGGGASLVALADGRPVDTTMGLTPAGGVVMASRSGDLDPGVLVHLMRTRGWGADRLEELVNRASGLRGLAGSGDVRTLLARRATDARADLALRIYVRSVRKAVGACAAVLGGLNLLVFTGGVGEHAAPLRREICAGLAHLGVPARAEEAPAARGGCAVRVVATDEERVMAGQVAAALRASAAR